MKINVSGHHVDVTDSVKSHIEEKLAKIANHFPTLISTEVIITKAHGKHHVELTTNYEGAPVVASANEEVMYPAIAQSVKKLDAALKHRKGQLKAKLHDKPMVTTPDIVHEKVQALNLN
ncbi:ribosome hibernation-promoting factor, HPF/YfiA family [Thalassotalea sediminis]|uniref:ribosome hibernation-promoting factor, HPF/YfiA family n=1 Tax=Thalassotalea sediminis TaxID=1759089 RepID=UPI0025726E5E|nr:ribosome-associated translation inhibitor RaiA [Thalassotalea sediminis]